MILVEVYGLSGHHGVTELRELVTGLSLFGHELVLWFADHSLQQQFEDAEWQEVRHLLDTVTLTGYDEHSQEKQQLAATASHRFRFAPVELAP